MTKTTRPRRSRGKKRTRSDQPSYDAQWTVVSREGVPPFQVKVPKITENASAEDAQKDARKEVPKDAQEDARNNVPEFVRLDMRRSGLRGKLARRPVLHRWEGSAGGFDPSLLVNKALNKVVEDNEGKKVRVTEASKGAFRRYRFFGSVGTLFSALATIIGALLVGLAAVSPTSGLGLGLLIGGGALTLVGVIALLASFYRAPA
jgi:hypothetical protein